MTKLKEQKKWKPFHATDFDSLIYPCSFIANILGVFPYKCVCSGYSYSRYSYSRIRFIYSMLMMIIFLGLFLLLEYKVNFEMRAYNTVPKIIHIQFYLLVAGIVVFRSFMQTGAKLRLLQRFAEVSSMLSPNDFDDMAKFVHSKDIFTYLFICIHLFNCVKDDPNRTLMNFVSVYMMMVIYIVTMLYVNCVCVLKSCFARINEDLEQLKKPVNRKFLRHGQGTAQLLMKLKNLEGKHMQVIDVLQLLNQTFLVHTVIIAVTTFTIVTFNLYFFILWNQGAEGKENYQQFWYAPYICSAVYHFLKFAVTIWACQTATNRAEQIRTTLHDVLGEATDLSVKRELELFSLQLLHHDTSFSAKLIKMNAVLLAEIVGGINMYLLILIQFLLNSVICRFTKNVNGER